MKKNQENQLMEAITSLAKRRGFIFPGSEIYGGLANTWDYGPLGVELKNNIKQAFWKRFVQSRDDMVGLDSALLMNTKAWEASGHISTFSDPLVECKKCHERFREDQLSGQEICPKDKKEHDFTEAKQFNLMLKTFLGPVEDEKNTVYLRPETAQGIFVNFKNIIDTTRKKLPFGVAQIGKAFRNEITPGNFIFRTREFEQMEIEYFIPAPEKDSEWSGHFEAWRGEMHEWILSLGIKEEHFEEVEIPKEDLAHYSRRTVDFEYKYPFGQKELYGLAYRTDFDLRNHGLTYTDDKGETFTPHVIEPSMGVDRTVLAVLLSAYEEEKTKDDTRVVLHLPNFLAPYKIAVFPLLKNRPELVAAALEIYHELKKHWSCDFDDNGNVGKRYRRQDEIGTPYCITIDFDTLEKGDVTIRHRDTMEQERIKITDLQNYFNEKINV